VRVPFSFENIAFLLKIQNDKVHGYKNMIPCKIRSIPNNSSSLLKNIDESERIKGPKF
jgi:hypothetical protein